MLDRDRVAVVADPLAPAERDARLDREPRLHVGRQHLVAVVGAAAPRRAPSTASRRRAPRCRPRRASGRPSSASPTSAPVPIRIRSGDERRLPDVYAPRSTSDAGARSERSSVGTFCRESESATGPSVRSSATFHAAARLVRVGRAHEPEIRDRAQRGVRLDRLVRRAVLAEPDRVVRPGPDDGQLHERGRGAPTAACSR